MLEKKVADKLLYIPIDRQNYPFCRLQKVVETFKQQNKWTNQSNSKQVPNVVKPMNKKKKLRRLLQ